jgi:hypothetical protein
VSYHLLFGANAKSKLHLSASVQVKFSLLNQNDILTLVANATGGMNVLECAINAPFEGFHVDSQDDDATLFEQQHHSDQTTQFFSLDNTR